MQMYLVTVFGTEGMFIDDTLVVWATSGEQALDLFEQHCLTVWKLEPEAIEKLALWAYALNAEPPAVPGAVDWNKMELSATRRDDEDDYRVDPADLPARLHTQTH